MKLFFPIVLVFFLASINLLGQISISNQLKTYTDPPYDMHNNEFSVRVRNPGGSWKNLYEYKTYVNSTSDRRDFEASSFVTFDFKGVVEIEVTCNTRPINSVIIRPQSRGISYTQLSSNKVSFFLSKPDQLSFEINGDRYKNMQIFANPMEGAEPSNITRRFKAGVIYNFPNHKCILNDNDVVYFEPGAVIKGGIYVEGKNNVKIVGRGIIDLTHLRKQYYHPNEYGDSYEYIQGVVLKRSTNVSMTDIIINDSQQLGIELTETSYIDINNIKVFTRVLWGDGIAIKGSDNINISKCFLRTADDGISIYSTRLDWLGNPYPQYRNTYDIKMSNSSIYADQSHPIEIGFHGSRNDIFQNGNWIGRFEFDEIDILEHDEPLIDYQGAISINCADGNTCTDIYFRNVRVEAMTQGRLLNLKVEPAGYGAAITNGFRIRNIVFDYLTYNGYGEGQSIIEGLSCDRFLDGVHFQDFKVNGNYVLQLSDYNFNTNQYAYNITFQEASNYSTLLPEGIYKIKNKKNNNYLTNLNIYSPFDNNGFYVATSGFNNSNNQKWELTKVAGHYRVKNVGTNNFLHNSDEVYINDCKSRYIWNYPNHNYSVQEWKIVPKGNGNYTINNAYTRGYLQPSSQSVNGNIQSKYIINAEKNALDEQLWIFEPVSANSNDKYAKTDEEFPVKLSPVPFSNFLQVEGLENISKWTITDINGKTMNSGISDDGSSNKITVNTTKLTPGIYYFNALKADGSQIQKTIIKK